MRTGEFLYNDLEHEASLGLVENRPIITNAYGCVFLGQWLKESEKSQGRGTYITNTGQIQEGYWKNGDLHGKGRMIFADGSMYEG